MLFIGADHVVAAAGSDVAVLLVIPVLWVVGVIVFVAFKFRSR